jgi:hypothetical protein
MPVHVKILPLPGCYIMAILKVKREFGKMNENNLLMALI